MRKCCAAVLAALCALVLLPKSADAEKTASHARKQQRHGQQEGQSPRLSNVRRRRRLALGDACGQGISCGVGLGCQCGGASGRRLFGAPADSSTGGSRSVSSCVCVQEPPSLPPPPLHPPPPVAPPPTAPPKPWGPNIGSPWRLVRRVQSGNTWHPATDQLSGTESYGTACGPTASCTFSVAFSTASYTHFLFATGDETKWLIATKEQAIGTGALGSAYSGQRTILRSSTSSTSYTAYWYRRSGATEDPWISLSDHSPAIAAGQIMYGGNSFGGAHASNILPVNNGANVYING